MAYNNYYPHYFTSPYNAPQMPQNAQQASGSNISWVQGETAAKSYPVGSGQSVLLMDSETSAFYIKSTDQSGMPLPLRVFDYKERQTAGPLQEASPVAASGEGQYVSRAEFDEFKEDVKRSIKGIRRPNIDTEEGEG